MKQIANMTEIHEALKKLSDDKDRAWKDYVARTDDLNEHVQILAEQFWKGIGIEVGQTITGTGFYDGRERPVRVLELTYLTIGNSYRFALKVQPLTKSGELSKREKPFRMTSSEFLRVNSKN